MIPESAITTLNSTLREMVNILSLDSGCPWLPPFAVLLEKAEKFQEKGYTEGELKLLVSAITHIYSVESGFTTYAPLEFNSRTSGYYYIIGTENFNEVSLKLYSIAEDILAGAGTEIIIE